MPRPVGLGLARPFARPVRTTAVLLAVASGAAAVTFAIGLGASLLLIQTALDQNTAHVTVQGGPGADPQAVLATIAAREGTPIARSVALFAFADATVAAG